MCPATRSKKPVTRLRTTSGSLPETSAVESTRSTNIAVASLRSTTPSLGSRVALGRVVFHTRRRAAGRRFGETAAVSADASAHADLLARASRALQEANWTTARALFAEALEREETPDALEGLGNAAFFLDEGETAVDARERAYR